ncbi:hypothetical protein ACS0TY_014562 [Phlomoides rotata]
MAPKRQSKRAVKTVVTSRKVVEETVQVEVSPPEDNERVELISSSTKQDEKLEILTVLAKTKSQKQKTIKEAKTDAPDDDETQPFSEPETAPTPPRKEAPPRKSGVKKRRKRGGGAEEYRRYVFMVMKQVHPEMGISSKAMTIVNNMMVDMFERLAEEAARLAKYTGRQTLSSREVQGAVKLVLPGELGKHAMSEGTKAVNHYVSYATN